MHAYIASGLHPEIPCCRDIILGLAPPPISTSDSDPLQKILDPPLNVAIPWKQGYNLLAT